MPMALVNPSITVLPSDKLPYEEGCLSFPGIRGDVIRPDRISVAYQDLHGIAHTLTCDGLLAHCIQHEVDHLDGTLYIDRMKTRSFATGEHAKAQYAGKPIAEVRKMLGL